MSEPPVEQDAPHGDDAMDVDSPAAAAPMFDNEPTGETTTNQAPIGEVAEATEEAEGVAEKDSNLESSKDNAEESEVAESEAAEDEPSKVEQPYSTRSSQPKDESMAERRGTRSTDQVSDAGDDLGVSVRSGFERENITTSYASTSFLDSLGEEERRTRTRYLPDVDGFHMLYKSEIKRDMGLARSTLSTSGVTTKLSSTRPPKIVSKRPSSLPRDVDRMDVDDQDGISQSEDERASEIIRIGGAVVDQDNNDFHVPSNAFVAPQDMTSGASLDTSRDSKIKQPLGVVVEAITAFNPPRPPESVGPKKKHRMLRWERRPEDVDVNLTNYRKTVQRTRKELQNAGNERERISTFGCLLRSHYLGQLNLMTEESNLLSHELASIQVGCVSGADLFSSRTRSRGAGKGSYVMRDVIAIVKGRGVELDGNGPPLAGSSQSVSTAGVGGLTPLAFVDWDRETPTTDEKISSGWTLPGDTVDTPYGEGIALHVYGPKLLDVAEVPPSDVHLAAPTSAPQSVGEVGKDSGDQPMTDASGGHDVTKPVDAKSNDGKPQEKGAGKKNVVQGVAGGGKPKGTGGKSSVKSMDRMLGPRVCVRLPFGIGYFPLDSVSSKEDPSRYSDPMLAARWKSMLETALSVSTSIDAAGMASSAKAFEAGFSADEGSEEEDGSEKMDVDNPHESNEHATTKDGASSEASRRKLPYGSGLLPTACGRGTLIAETSVPQLEKDLNQALYEGGGVFGKPDNVGVPQSTADWEEIRQDSISLQASVLHLRNQLYRQRRIRGFNELTYAACRSRSLRAEALVKEMRADLKSLKNRLEAEILEMGIGGEKAEALLTSYYTEKENEDFTGVEATPPKRVRKVIRDVPQFSPKQTRRRGLDNPEELAGEGDQIDEMDALDEEESETNINEGSSDEEVDSQPAPKRARYEE